MQWNGNIAILMTFSSLATLEVAILTTCGAHNNESLVKMTTFPSQCLRARVEQWWCVVESYLQICRGNQLFDMALVTIPYKGITSAGRHGRSGPSLLTFIMMTSSNRNIFRVTGHLCGEFTCPGDSPHKGQWRRALMFSLICAWINVWVNNHKACDLRCYLAHYDVIVMA